MSKTIMQRAILAVMLAAGYSANAGDTPALSFTVEQVKLGRVEFGNSCANCHGPTLGGGPGAPPLNSASFRVHWRLRTADELATYIRTKMPPDSPGGLPETAYVNLVAYIL